MKQAKRGPRSGVSLSALVISLIISGPLCVLVGWYVTDQTHSALPIANSEPVYAPIESADVTVPVEVRLGWSEERTLAYRGQPGLVTAVNIERGSALSNGTELFSVDGKRVRAMSFGSPPIAAIDAKSNGSQIQSLNEFLLASGYDVAANGERWSPKTSSAVKAYQKDHGLDIGTQFDPTMTVWLPPGETFRVSGDLPTVGFPVASSEEEVLTGEPNLVAATVVPGGISLSGGSIQIGAETVGVGEDSSIDTLDLPLLQAEVSIGAETLAVSGTPASGSGLLAVPPSAVVATTDGVLCLGILQGSSQTVSSVRVTVAGGVPGISYLEETPELIGEMVLVNPIDAQVAVTC